MTSANVTHYTVTDKDGKVVLETQQHHYCGDKLTEKLKALPNPESLSIEAMWPDEQECDHYSRPMPLDRYLSGETLVYPSTMGEELYDENQKLKEMNKQLMEMVRRLLDITNKVAFVCVSDDRPETSLRNVFALITKGTAELDNYSKSQEASWRQEDSGEEKPASITPPIIPRNEET